ncbi:MAG: palmitoyltransferase swf1 [Piccolia ochrophora]|nr:MAG: palmitoyltransferase swf1 [Piccolia ochrophora]
MSDPGIVNTANHQDAMARYPYDYALFHPGVLCKTCELTKPARSKHCRICKHCIEKHDHHCAWVNNCLGYNNYHHFLLLLFSTGLLLVYGAYLSRGILSDDLHLVRSQDGVSLLRKDGIYVQPLEPFQKHWSANLGWSEYFALWRWAIIDDSYVGIVGLLCVLCAPLSWGLLIFHLYLTWAGMTTNESAKWSKWKDDIEDGLVFKAKRSRVTTGDAQDLSITASSAARSPDTASSRWPVCSDQILLFKEDGVDPGEATLDTEEDVASPWRRVFSLQEVDNLYDLGFWENLLDHFGAIHV